MIMANNEKNRLSRKRFLSPCALEMCVLSLSNREECYGYKLSKNIGLEVTESTLYPVLRRLEAYGFLVSHRKTHNSKLRKMYSITPKGTEQLEHLKKEWRDFMEFVSDLLETNI
jgi:Predicted transcriptional regulators